MNNEQQVLFAGFGGQGILSMGKFLTYAAMGMGKTVSWLPAYGAEMRGGTANCLVTIAEGEIFSPLTENPGTAIILNRPSLDRFETKIKPNGTLVMNTSLIDRDPVRQDLDVFQMPVNQIADEQGSSKLANMILLGACIQKIDMVTVQQTLGLFELIFTGKKPGIIDKNREAFLFGVEYAQKNW